VVDVRGLDTFGSKSAGWAMNCAVGAGKDMCGVVIRSVFAHNYHV